MLKPGTDEQGKQRTQLIQLNEFLEDLMLLATYAVECGRLPEQINMADIYAAYSQKIEDGMPLLPDDIEVLQYYFQLLKLELEPVSPGSLRATACNFDQNPMNTEAGKSVKHMWYWAFASIFSILAISLYQYVFDFSSADWAKDAPNLFFYLTIGYWVANSIAPFVYGALGASLRILRTTESHLRNRSFDPRRLPEHRTRWVLGTISGGVIVMLYSSGGIGDTSVKLTQVALGFLAGYSIDLMFSILDNLVNMLTPAKTGNTQIQQRSRIPFSMKFSGLKKNIEPQSEEAKRTDKIRSI